MKVLISDDSQEGIDVVTELLDFLGYEVVPVRESCQVLDIAKSERPDVILMDLRQPRPNGAEVMAMLKNAPDLAHIPVIALTALPKFVAEHEEDFVNGGFANLLDKCHFEFLPDLKAALLEVQSRQKPRE